MRCARQALERAAVERHAAGLRGQLAGQHVEGRGLAGAVRTDHAVDAGPVEREREPVEDRDLADPHVDAVDDERAAPRRARAACGAAIGSSRRGGARPKRRSSGAKTPIRPCGNSSTTTMKTIAIVISQNGKRVAQPARQRADQHGTDDRPEQPSAAADGGPDHEVGREREAAQLRRHQALLRRVQRTADAGEQAADAERDRLQPVGVEAEQHDAAFVVRERGPQHAERRAVQPGDDRAPTATSAIAAT